MKADMIKYRKKAPLITSNNKDIKLNDHGDRIIT